jgi:Flp pilus assembly protein TadG
MSMLFSKRFIRDERGQAVVEATLAGLICISAFFWIMEWGMCMYCQSILSQAAMNGLQYATSHGTMAFQNSGNGSGPGTNDPTGSQNVVPAVEAWMGQSALKGSVASMQVCPAWWSAGSAAGGAGNASCSAGGGNAANANPGTVVTVQVFWPYQPYVRLPFISPTLSYTATGTVVY